MIKITLAGVLLLGIASAATAQMGNSTSSGTTAEPAMKSSGAHTTTMKKKPMKKKPMKGTSHNGRSSMPAGGTDSSAPMGNSM